jgi:hypothetical protein
MDYKKFFNKLNEETGRVIKEQKAKEVAKEDALTLVADFVKDVKKKFSDDEDRVEILRAASKTLDFYIDEIEEGEEEEEFGEVEPSEFEPMEGEEETEEETEE